MYMVEHDGKKEWIMLVDGFQEQYYGAYRSQDLKQKNRNKSLKLATLKHPDCFPLGRKSGCFVCHA